MAFATRLRELREGAKLTQGQLAKTAGLSIRAVSHLEQGLREPAWATLQKLSSALGVGIEVFSSPATTIAPARGRGRPRKPAAAAGPATAAAPKPGRAAAKPAPDAAAEKPAAQGKRPRKKGAAQ